MDNAPGLWSEDGGLELPQERWWWLHLCSGGAVRQASVCGGTKAGTHCSFLSLSVSTCCSACWLACVFLAFRDYFPGLDFLQQVWPRAWARLEGRQGWHRGPFLPWLRVVPLRHSQWSMPWPQKRRRLHPEPLSSCAKSAQALRQEVPWVATLACSLSCRSFCLAPARAWRPSSIMRLSAMGFEPMRTCVQWILSPPP